MAERTKFTAWITKYAKKEALLESLNCVISYATSLKDAVELGDLDHKQVDDLCHDLINLIEEVRLAESQLDIVYAAQIAHLLNGRMDA